MKFNGHTANEAASSISDRVTMFVRTDVDKACLPDTNGHVADTNGHSSGHAQQPFRPKKRGRTSGGHGRTFRKALNLKELGSKMTFKGTPLCPDMPVLAALIRSQMCAPNGVRACGSVQFVVG